MGDRLGGGEVLNFLGALSSALARRPTFSMNASGHSGLLGPYGLFRY